MPKDTTATSSRRGNRRHDPLHEELLETGDGGHLRKTARTKQRRTTSKDDSFVDSHLSGRILQLAKEQQDEITMEDAGAASRRAAAEFMAPGAGSLRIEDMSDEEGEGEYEEYGDSEEEEEIEEVEVDEEDMELFNRFLPGQPQEQRVSLADKILEKIAEHEAKQAGISMHPADDDTPQLPPKVIEVYMKVGILLSRYKSGKLPKAFKIIPSLRNWEEIIYLTRPDKWTAHACFEATKLFASQKSAQTQKFLSTILLERVRDDIAENKRLNIHLYNSMKKSLYKPAAFFKGFLFPLCNSSPTLKEAQIVGSVLSRISIPVLHSAAALLHLCEMDYTGPTSVFIQTLLDKKYALPYKVVDAVVFHFMRFKAVEEALPLLWHKSFLSFAQRYRNDITEDQRDVLLDLLQAKGHPLVGPEIRRELLEGRGRGVEVEMMDTDLMLE